MKNKLTLAMLLACSLGVLLGFSVKVAAAPTIPNPSFEDPGHTDANPFIILPAGSTYITGWTVGGPGVDYFRGSPFASDGLYSVNYVRGPGEGGSISTTISGLIAGTEYDLSFDVIQRDLSAGTALTAIVDSTSQTYINTASDVYQRQHLLFIAGGATAALTFAGPTTGAVDSAFAHVDNVMIAEAVANVGGLITGMSPSEGTVICRNVTTRQTVRITIPAGVRSWNCAQAGLIVNPGDEIKQSISVRGPAD